MGYGSTVIRKGVTVFYLPESEAIIRIAAVSGLFVPRRSVPLDDLLELCQLQTLYERMGGVPCSFTQECNTIGESTFQPCAVRFFFSRLFFLHLLWDHMEFPSLCVCLLWTEVVGIRVERHSSPRLQLLRVFTCQLFK